MIKTTIFLLLIATPVFAQEAPQGIEIRFHQDDLYLAQNYCETFFREQGLLLKKPIKFKTMDDVNFPLANRGKLIGAYNTDDRTVYINSYSSLVQQKVEVFGQPLTRDWYISYLVHEISHAYIRDNWTASNLNIPLQEYLAYSIQLGFINPKIRNQLFSEQPVEDTDDREGILGLHDYHPYRFAMYSYTHFTKQKKNYLKQVMGGQQ